MVDHQHQESVIFGAELLLESIQDCHVSMEESRRHLMPILKVLDGEGDGDSQRGVVSSGTKQVNGIHGCGEANDKSHTDVEMVQEIFSCIEGTSSLIDELMGYLADSGLVSLDSQGKIDHTQYDNHQVSEDQMSYLLMAHNCISKASDFVSQNFLKVAEADSVSSTSSASDPLDDVATLGSNSNAKIQSLIARLAELALRLICIKTSFFPASFSAQTPTTRLKSEPGVSRTEEENSEIAPNDIFNAYSRHQRRCLRARSKQAISSLVELRRVATSQKCYVSDIVEEQWRRRQLEVEAGELDGEFQGGADSSIGGGAGALSREQPHAQANTVILGEASSLIQPLAAWRDALSPSVTAETNALQNQSDISFLLRQLCQEAMDVLDNEAQTLAVMVGSWFGLDQRGIVSLQQPLEHGEINLQENDLESMEAALEEMAFLCQVLSRYCLFSQQTIVRTHEKTANNSPHNTKLQDLLTEISLQYSTLETRLATLQLKQALLLASPQLIELGRPALLVPSIVEDAHYVCVRAIERAAGTRSEHAIWTVGHWVCETWGVTGNIRGEPGSVGEIHQALIQGIGCNVVLDTGSNDKGYMVSSGVHFGVTGGTTSDAENSFTAALLDAVDDDIGHGDDEKTNVGASYSGGVSSGLWNKLGRGGKFGVVDLGGKGGTAVATQESIPQNKINAELCALNGILAAKNACSALSGLFADLLEERLEERNSDNKKSQKSSMLSFARDELASHSCSYHRLLQNRVQSLVIDLCGSDDIFDCDGHLCLQNLRLFIEQEVYHVDASSFRELESEDRLEAHMVRPIRESQIFREVGMDKCDSAVVLLFAEAMSLKSADIVLQCLLQGEKHFNDWGAMLLSKQVRTLQNLYCECCEGTNTSTVLAQFDRVNQAVSILQLERPSDWLAFSYRVGESNDKNLTKEEIQQVMRLRVDFSDEAITNVCSQINNP